MSLHRTDIFAPVRDPAPTDSGAGPALAALAVRPRRSKTDPSFPRVRGG